MKMNMYTLFDRAAGAYTRPFFAKPMARPTECFAIW